MVRKDERVHEGQMTVAGGSGGGMGQEFKVFGRKGSDISLLLHHPCHLALLPHHSQQLPSGPPASAIPSFPCHLSLLAPTPCPIWLPAITPPAPPQSGPPTPTPPKSSPKLPSTQKENLSFCEFPNFPMLVSVSSGVGSISSQMTIIPFTLCGKIPKIVVKQPRFHQ